MARDEILDRIEAACAEMGRLHTNAEARGLTSEQSMRMAFTVGTSVTVLKACRAIAEEAALPDSERRARGWEITPEEWDAEALPSLAAGVDRNLKQVNDWHREWLQQ